MARGIGRKEMSNQLSTDLCWGPTKREYAQARRASLSLWENTKPITKAKQAVSTKHACWRLNYNITKMDTLKMLETQKHLCPYCHRLITIISCSIEHIIPICRGGSKSDKINMELTCWPCNKTKGTWTRDEFLEIIRRISSALHLPVEWAESWAPGEMSFFKDADKYQEEQADLLKQITAFERQFDEEQPSLAWKKVKKEGRRLSMKGLRLKWYCQHEFAYLWKKARALPPDL